MNTSSRFNVGEWVEVRSKEEILRTLDANSQLDGMPFMPEMVAFCGKRFRVYKRAHKTCDTVFPIRGRRVADAVHLETRCNGQAHGGCQANCLIFWKEAWVKRVNGDLENPGSSDTTTYSGRERAGSTSFGCTEQDVYRGARAPGDADDSNPSYSCQATQVPYATTPLSSWDARQYLEDYISGNVGLGRMARGLVYMSYNSVINLGIGLGAPLRWFYDFFQSIFGGLPYPRRAGRIPLGERTPSAKLDLQPGERVRVKSYKEILATCDESNRNRGMGFDAEMVPYCGGTYRVLKRVTKIINERTGKMQEMKNPCIILEDVVCQGRYSECRLFCPRAIYPYWREIWLERIPDIKATSPSTVSRKLESEPNSQKTPLPDLKSSSMVI